MFDGSAALDMPDYFQQVIQERRGDTLNVRLPKRQKDQLRMLERIWTEKQKISTRDKGAEQTMGDVVVRLLAVGLAGAWEELKIGLDEHGNPAEAEVEKLIEKLKVQAKSVAS